MKNGTYGVGDTVRCIDKTCLHTPTYPLTLGNTYTILEVVVEYKKQYRSSTVLTKYSKPRIRVIDNYGKKRLYFASRFVKGEYNKEAYITYSLYEHELKIRKEIGI